MRSDLPLFPQAASTQAPQVDAIFLFALGVTVVFSLLIAVLVITFAVKYRRRSPDAIGEVGQAANWLEVVWSIIPLGILLLMFGWGAKVYFRAYRPPADAAEYYVVAKQWMWKFQHPAGNREINHLHVPVGQPIRLTMTSEDAIHSFYVPAFRIKMDVLPGRYTTAWFQATKPGSYRLFCAEYCGTEHSLMGGTIEVLEPKDYEAWLAGATGGTGGESGPELFSSLACNTCHRDDTVARAPQLKGLPGTTVALRDGGSVVADDDYLRESILNPAAKVVEGYDPVMPTFKGQITEEQLIQLISYIKSLGKGPGS